MKKFAAVLCVIVVVSLIAGLSSYAMPQRSTGMALGEHLSNVHEKESTQAVAQVGNVVIYEAEIDAYREKLAVERGVPKEQVSVSDARNLIIENVVLEQKAAEMGFEVTDEEVAREVEFQKQYYNSIPQYKEIVDDYCLGAGITLDEFFSELTESFKRSMSRTKLRDYVVGEYLAETGREEEWRGQYLTETQPYFEEYVDSLVSDMQNEIIVLE